MLEFESFFLRDGILQVVVSLELFLGFQVSFRFRSRFDVEQDLRNLNGNLFHKKALPSR
jgi:hypothetical protein